MNSIVDSHGGQVHPIVLAAKTVFQLFMATLTAALVPLVNAGGD